MINEIIPGFDRFSNDKIWTLPNWKSFQKPILNLMKKTESSSKLVENIVGKGEIARLRAISPFPTVFKRFALQTRKNQTLLGKRLMNHRRSSLKTLLEKNKMLGFFFPSMIFILSDTHFSINLSNNLCVGCECIRFGQPLNFVVWYRINTPIIHQKASSWSWSSGPY